MNLASIRQKLLDLRDELTHAKDAHIEPNRRDPYDVGMDEDEQPLNEMNQAIASRRNRNRQASLGQIEAALLRLQNDPDEFGLCRECEEPIGERRLLLMPHVELCAECQQRTDEGSRQPATRRHLRDYR